MDFWSWNADFSYEVKKNSMQCGNICIFLWWNIFEKNLDCFHQFLWLHKRIFMTTNGCTRMRLDCIFLNLIKVKVIKFMECMFQFKENSFPNLKFKIFQTTYWTKLTFKNAPPKDNFLYQIWVKPTYYRNWNSNQ